MLKLLPEVDCSLQSVDSLTCILPSALWVRIAIDAHTGIPTVEKKRNSTGEGHTILTAARTAGPHSRMADEELDRRTTQQDQCQT